MLQREVTVRSNLPRRIDVRGTVTSATVRLCVFSKLALAGIHGPPIKEDSGMSDKNSGPEEAIKGVVEGVKG